MLVVLGEGQRHLKGLRLRQTAVGEAPESSVPSVLSDALPFAELAISA
jgi:hypothetical protein